MATVPHPVRRNDPREGPGLKGKTQDHAALSWFDKPKPHQALGCGHDSIFRGPGRPAAFTQRDRLREILLNGFFSIQIPYRGAHLMAGI
jgi:hypothetical protein